MGKRIEEGPINNDDELDEETMSSSSQQQQRPTGPSRKPTKQFVAHSKRNASTTRLNKLKTPEEFRRIKSTDNVMLKRNKSKNKMHQLTAATTTKDSQERGDSNQNQEYSDDTSEQNYTENRRHNNGGILQLEHEDSDDDEQPIQSETPPKDTNTDNNDIPQQPPVTPPGGEASTNNKSHTLPVEEEHKVAPPSQGAENNPDASVTTPQKMSESESESEWKPSILLQSPAPRPQLTTETVLAVSEMSPSNEVFPRSSGSNGSDSDMKSTFLDKSASSADLRTTTTRTQQKLWLQRDLNLPHQQHQSSLSSLLLTTEQRREFERISKEYQSVRNFYSPVVGSLERLKNDRFKIGQNNNMIPKTRKGNKQSNGSSSNNNLSGSSRSGSPTSSDYYSSGLSQSLPKRVSSLSATTLKSPTTPSNTWHAVSPTYSSNIAYLLNRMWMEGTSGSGSESDNNNDPENNSQQNNNTNNKNSSSSPTFSGNAPSINSQAQLVNARIRQQAAA